MNLILIRRARIPHRKFWMRANIVINPSTGKIVKIYKTDKANKYILQKIDMVIDAKEKLVIPAPIDLNNDLCLSQNEKKIIEITQKALEGGILISTSILNKKENKEKLKEKLKISKIKIYIYLNAKEFIISRDMFTDKDLRVLGYYMRPEEIDDIDSGQLEEKLMVVDVSNLDSSSEYGVVRNIVERIPKVHFMGVKNPATIGYLNSLIKKGFNKTYDVPIYEILYLDDAKGGIFPKILSRDKSRKVLLAKLLRKQEIFSVSTNYRCDNALNEVMLSHFFPIYFTLAKKLDMVKPLQIIEPTSINPRILIEGKKTRIKVGAPADLLIFNHRTKWKIMEKPLENIAIRGRIEAMIANGKVVS